MDKKILAVGHNHIGASMLTGELLEAYKRGDLIVVENDNLHEALNNVSANTFVLKAPPRIEDFDPYAKKRRQLEAKIDVLKEYDLIQQKKSKLSRWERDEVVRIVTDNK